MRTISHVSAVSVLALVLFACSSDSDNDVSSSGASTDVPAGPVTGGGIGPGTLNPDNTVSYPDGTLYTAGQILPNGNVVNADGTVTMPDGTVTDAAGNVITPAATTPLPSGGIGAGAQLNADGTVTNIDGSVTSPGQILPNGSTLNADGTVTMSDGTVTDATGNVVVPADTAASTTVTPISGGTDPAVAAEGTAVVTVDEECRTVKEGVEPDQEEQVLVTELTETVEIAVPPVILFVVDTSLSMDESAGDGSNATKWEATQEAMSDVFATIPSDWAVGIIYYPNVNGLPPQEPCIERELAVPVAPMTADQVGALDASLNRTPGGGTPTHDAFVFATETLAQATLPAEYDASPRYVIVLTDGVPRYPYPCEGEQVAVVSEPVYNELIADVAEAAAQGSRTYWIGSPGSEDPQGATYDPREKLSELASAGDTALAGCSHTGPSYCHFDMTQEPNFLAGLTAALGEIIVTVESQLDSSVETVTSEIATVQTVDLCSYQLPEAPANKDLALNEVLAVYYPGGGTQGQEIYQTTEGDADTCASGWAFNDPVAPTHIIFCSDTCELIQADAEARVVIDIGCYEIG